MHARLPDLVEESFDTFLQPGHSGAVTLIQHFGPAAHIAMHFSADEAVWGTIGAVTSRTLETHVSRIHNKLGLLPKNGWHLKGVYGHGYRLEQVARMEEHEEAA